MKNILFIYNKDFIQAHSRHIHSHWAIDCQNDYNIKFWGNGFVEDKDLTLNALKKEIDKLKPDFIYMTGRKKYNKHVFSIEGKNKIKTTKCWLPDLTSIKNVPKIFVDVDTFRYDANDDWYKQFDRLYCRCNRWGNWKNVPVLKWSVSEISFPQKNIDDKRKGIYFVGTIDKKAYVHRRKMRDFLKKDINFCTIRTDEYWDVLHQALALVCPTEGRIGKNIVPFIPAKFFEYIASGAAVLTNCDIETSNIPELDNCVIKYKSLHDLKDKLKMDFIPYINIGISIMRNHTHRVRYRELFG